jgi:hypothetical protein
MLEIKPVSTTFPVTKPAIIKKEDEHPPNQQPAKKKPAQNEKKPAQPDQHIDEMA